MGRTTMASMDGKSGEVDVPQSLSSRVGLRTACQSEVKE
jgi:hypothetical protein